jgi:hypothetical protein
MSAVTSGVGALDARDGSLGADPCPSRVKALRARWRLELETGLATARTLRAAGFTRTSNARIKAWFSSLVLVVAFVTALVRGAPETVVGGLVALGAVLVGAQQFAAARNEVSLEKFYDRLQVTNDRLEEYRATREFIGLPYGWTQDRVDDDQFHRRMYVFRELDNLEYSIAKYRIGFMSRDNAHRSLRTFTARCAVSEEFCRMAHDQVHGTKSKQDTGYDRQTKFVLCRIMFQLGYLGCGDGRRPFHTLSRTRE